MSENRDEPTGQFTSAEPLFGQEALEHDAGYVPYKDDETAAEPEELTAKEAAENLTLSRTPESAIKTYGLDLPDNVSLTIDQAAKIAADVREADALESEGNEAQKIRDEVDELRGVKPDAEQAAEAKAAEPATPESDVEKFLAIPHVKEAVEKFTGEVETVRNQYSQALNAANDIARTTFMGQFPEIAALPMEQWEGALAAMAQREPDRFKAAFNSLSRVNELQIAQQHQQQQLRQQEHAKLQQTLKTESDRFEQMVKDTPKAQRAEIENSIVEAIKEYGGDDQLMELLELAKRSSVAQRLLWDVGKLRALQKAPAKAAPKNLPPVQRPGAARERVSSDAGRVQALEGRFASARSSEAQMRIAAELMTLKRAAKRG